MAMPSTIRTLERRKSDFRQDIGDFDKNTHDKDTLKVEVGTWETAYRQFPGYDFWELPMENLAHTCYDPDAILLEVADNMGAENFPKRWWTILADLRGYVTIIVGSGRFSHSEEYGWTFPRHQNRIEWNMGDVDAACEVAHKLIAAFTL